MRYESIEFHGEESAEAALARDDPAELLYVPVAASLHSDDRKWAERLCVRLARHPHFNVRGNAVLGFAHLARRFRQLDRAVVEPLLIDALADPHPYVSGPPATPPTTFGITWAGVSRLRFNVRCCGERPRQRLFDSHDGWVELLAPTAAA